MSYFLLRAVLLLSAFSACSDLSEFRATENKPFTGEVVGGGDTSFIRRGFAPSTLARLTFHPDRIGGGEPIGTLTTESEADAVPLFRDTPYRSVAPVEHDVLSDYDLPGRGRIRNYLFVASPAMGPLAGRDALIFMSLMDSERIEMRVLLSGGEDETRDYFGLFRLGK